MIDVETHFTPKYNPWDERLRLVPDGDLFKSISEGKASVVTDRIKKFTENGILLESGKLLEADVIVTATGLNMLAFSRIQLTVDDKNIQYPDTTIFKSMMLSDVPNLAFAFGYTKLILFGNIFVVCLTIWMKMATAHSNLLSKTKKWNEYPSLI